MWPFKKTRGSARGSAEADVRYDDTFVHIRSENFYGQYSRSRNGEYTVAWRDSAPDGRTGGFRYSGEGDYILLRAGRVLSRGRLQRPNDERVADNGAFVLNDWMFGDGLKGTFCAFDQSGELILEKRFKANLEKSGISRDGSFAACQTLGSDNEGGNLLTIFDLTQKRVANQWRAESGAASDYDFDPSSRTILLIYGGGGYEDYPDPKWAYTYDGEFIDRDKWINDKLTWGNFPTLIMTVQDLVRGRESTLESQTSRKLLRSVELAIRKGADKYPDWYAHALRLAGILHEGLGERREASVSYRQALVLDPKIGVKRRLEALTKRGLD